MNRNDFLDILRDYLKEHFNEVEISDILRDYEEFFLNGELEGKTDDEIIGLLGSPKQIANELIEEMKNQKSNKSTSSNYNSKGKIKPILNEWLIRFKSVGKKACGKAKEVGNKVYKKSKRFLDSRSVVNGERKPWEIKLMIFLLSLILFIPSVIVWTGTIASGAGLIALTGALIFGYTVAFTLGTTSVSINLFIVFLCFLGTSFLIILWALYCNIVKFLIKILRKYVSWVKTRNMYIKVKCKKEKYKKDMESKETMEYGKKTNSETKVEEKSKEVIEEVELIEKINVEEIKVEKNVEDTSIKEVINIKENNNKGDYIEGTLSYNTKQISRGEKGNE